ncbi:hypothetical protein HK097_000315 [Rhizophlyctis rosea]|uniref:Uncharacterized protein n=1 Tax=Rhizophlyctis rosea TaxID=64517 RepID=A0AAD5WYX9_9FUNG|nr:hypothetical protein HK097_000315 [Rhizophlyctis rosea]
MAEKNLVFELRAAPRLLLYLAQSFRTGHVTEITFPEEVRKAAKYIRELTNIELTHKLVMAIVSIRSLMQALAFGRIRLRIYRDDARVVQ